MDLTAYHATMRKEVILIDLQYKNIYSDTEDGAICTGPGQTTRRIGSQNLVWSKQKVNYFIRVSSTFSL